MAVKGILFNIQKFSLHDGPGIRTVVFFQGCPLSCLWCSNPESQGPGTLPQFMVPPQAGPLKAMSSEVREYTLEEVMAVCLQDLPFYEESGGGVTLSGGEALVQHDFSAALLDGLKSRGVHTAMETSGYAAPDIFRQAADRTDLLLFDVKHYDDRRHAKGTGVSQKLILENLKTALQTGKTVLPRIPVIPGFNADPKDARGFVDLFDGLGLCRVQILPFHQFGEKKYSLTGTPYAFHGVPQLHPEDLEEYRRIFLDAGINCFL